jgi:DNA-binding NarL/FixJ family response regulator
MRPPRNTVAICGLERLFYEIVKDVFSHYGWNVTDLRELRLDTSVSPEIAVLFCSNGLQHIIENIRVVRSVISTARIVVVGLEASEDQMLRLVEEGIYASVPANGGLSSFLDTLQQVLDHQVSCTGRMTQLVRNRIAQLSAEQNARCASVLTRREEEVLDLIAGGCSNKEIAGRLCITTNTVKNHVHRVLEKVNARSRHDAAWIHSHSPRPFPTIGTVA